MDKIYCINCKKLFDDRMETRRREGIISWGQFMYNQQQIIWYGQIGKQICNTAGEVIVMRLFKGNKRTFQVNCPHCSSINTVNGTKILEQRVHGGDRRSQEFILYKAVKEAFEKEGLSTMNDIVRYGDS